MRSRPSFHFPVVPREQVVQRRPILQSSRRGSVGAVVIVALTAPLAAAERRWTPGRPRSEQHGVRSRW